MIKSILDTDVYKFSMSWAYFNLYPLAEGTFKFNDRNKESWTNFSEFMGMMREEFDKLADLKLSEEEKDWCIEHIPYIPASYWEWLQTFRFDPKKIQFWLDEEGVFQCEVTDKIYKSTLYEIAVLSTFAEVRNRLSIVVDNSKVKSIIDEKVKFANYYKIPFMEFGTRRRFSSAVQEIVINAIKENSKTCTGTSNVYYAMKFGMTPQGTCAHEWTMFHAAVFGYKRANYLSLEDWTKVYDGDLGTALIDCYTTDSFLRTLTRKQAHLLSGFRQDSGDEKVVGNAIINRLKEFNIDPKSKLIIFSNALDLEKAKGLMEYFAGQCKVGFGIGTNLTCDVDAPGFKPANIVMKLNKCRMSAKDPWEKCIKISDDMGKRMGDEKEFEIAKYELHLD